MSHIHFRRGVVAWRASTLHWCRMSHIHAVVRMELKVCSGGGLSLHTHSFCSSDVRLVQNDPHLCSHKHWFCRHVALEVVLHFIHSWHPFSANRNHSAMARVTDAPKLALCRPPPDPRRSAGMPDDQQEHAGAAQSVMPKPSSIPLSIGSSTERSSPTNANMDSGKSRSRSRTPRLLPAHGRQKVHCEQPLDHRVLALESTTAQQQTDHEFLVDAVSYLVENMGQCTQPEQRGDRFALLRVALRARRDSQFVP